MTVPDDDGHHAVDDLRLAHRHGRADAASTISAIAAERPTPGSCLLVPSTAEASTSIFVSASFFTSWLKPRPRRFWLLASGFCLPTGY